MCVESLLDYYCRDSRHCEGVSALKSILRRWFIGYYVLRKCTAQEPVEKKIREVYGTRKI